VALREPPRSENDRPGGRTTLARGFEGVEHLLNAAIAIALAIGGIALFVHVVLRFGREMGDTPFVDATLALLDGLILVFIVTELLHTLRSVISEGVLTTEPFLVVGIVAIIRRLIVISAEASGEVGHASFDDLMLEMGVLVGAVLALGLVIYLLRHTEHVEPRPRIASDRTDGDQPSGLLAGGRTQDGAQSRDHHGHDQEEPDGLDHEPDDGERDHEGQ
jgi:uncharacterized membrane protein (DUF373 family)